MAVNLLHDKLCLFIIAALALCLPNYALRPPVAASQRFARSGGAAGLRSDSSLRQIPKDNISQELTSRDASYLKVKSAITLPPDSVIDPVMATDNLSYYQFGAIFRHSAPYIAMYRGSVMVIHVPGAVLFKKKLFQGLMDDISILHLLGIKLVLVVGLREQLDKRLEALQVDSKYHNGMRITDEQLLRILKEESGAARIEIESAFVRGIKGMAGKRGIDVVSGNFFYSAKPLGVREGVDYKFTGEVRKVDVDSFRKRLDCGDVVLLTSLGHSPSGEVFNVPSESLAAECAAKLNAVKIIYFSNGEGMIDTRTGRTIQNLRLGQAQTLLENWGIAKSSYNYVDEDADLSKQDEDSSIDESFNVPLNTFHSETRSLSSTSQQFNSTTDNSVGAAIDAQTVGILYVSTNGSSVQKVESDPKSLTKETRPSDISSFLRLLARSVYALNGGVRRAHLILPFEGALLKELYTRDGAGILISRDTYEGLRQATASDLRDIQEITRPLEAEGILKPRTAEEMERELENCFLLTRDNDILAMGMLKQFGDQHAEIYCLAVHPSYRRGGKGETMLAYLERRALMMGLPYVFVLSTRTMQWFEERGFEIATPADLPPERHFDPSRNSRIYMKRLRTERDVDEEEVLWDIT